MKLPLKVNMGFWLHVRHCEDLRLISFRCSLASAFVSAHTYAPVCACFSHSIFQTLPFAGASSGRASVEKYRVAFVPTSKNNSVCLDSLAIARRQMETLIYD